MKSIIIFVLSLVSISAFSNIKDSIQSIQYLERAKQLADKSPKSAIHFIDSGLKLSDTINNYSNATIRLLGLKADILISDGGRKKEAEKIIEKVLEKPVSVKDSLHLYDMLSFIEAYAGRFDQTINYATKGAQIAKRHKFYGWEADFLVTIADHLEFSLESPKKAIPLYSRALKIAHDSSFYDLELIASMFFMDIHKNNPDSCEFYHRSARKAIDNCKSPGLTANYYRQLGSHLSEKGKIKEAIDSLLIGYELIKNTGKSCILQPMELELSEAYLKHDNLQMAEFHALNGLSLSEINESPETDSELYKVLSNLFEKRGDTDQAFFYHKKHTTIKDSIFSLKKIASANITVASYGQKEQQVKLETITSLAHKHRTTTIISFGLIAFLSIISLYYWRRNKKRLNEIKGNLNVLKNEKIGIEEEKALLEKLVPEIQNKKILLKTSGTYINTNEILFVEASKKHVLIFVENKDKPIIEREGFLKFTEFLPSYFIQIHRSFVINTQKINKRYSRSKIEMSDGTDLTISRSFVNKVGDIV